MNKIILQILAIVSLFIAGCSGQNDNFDQYLKNGERIYIGKLDSVKVLSGINRFKIMAYTSDPRIENMTVYWSQRTDSVNLAIPAHSAKEAVEFIIDKGEKPLQEQNYVLEFVNFDANNNKSITVEAITEVYGDYYLSQLYNLRTRCTLTEDEENGNELKIEFSPKVIESESGIYIIYKNNENGWTREKYSREEIDNDLKAVFTLDNTVLPASKDDYEVYLQSVFVPEEECIDTVYMPKKAMVSLIKDADITNTEEISNILAEECLKIYPVEEQ